MLTQFKLRPPQFGTKTKRSALSYTEIPESVINIGDYAFASTDLTEFVIPNNVDSIGVGAFYGCSKMQKILINSRANISEEAFAHCYELSELILSEGIEKILERAFYYNNLKKIVIPSTINKIATEAFSTPVKIESDIYISDVNKWCKVEMEDEKSSPFYSPKYYVNNEQTYNRKAKLFVNDTLVSTLPIEGVDSINNYVFFGCQNLERIIIGNSVKSIGKYAFSECYNLTEVSIGNNVSVIEKCAFENTNLKKISIGKAVEEIEERVFNNTSITVVYCYANKPPQLDGGNFGNIDKETAKLYVPKGTYSAYYLSNWGSLFTNIIEMD